MNKKLLSALIIPVFILNTFGSSVALAMETTPEETEPIEVTETTDVTETSSDETYGVVEESSDETTTTDETTAETTVETDGTTTVDETTAETEETEETEETTAIVVPPEAFDQQVIVGDTIIRVIADEGVFPNNSTLSAEEVEYDDISEDQNVVRSLTFDICIFDEDGNEVEPDGDVQVLFENSLISDENLDTTVYHEEVELGYEMVEDDCIIATTDGFSYYTVEFTYNTLEFELACDTDTQLSAILTAVGLTGTPTNCVSSTDKIYVSTINDEYWITSEGAFNTTETLTVTINDIDYVINIICDEHAPETATAGVDAYAILYSSGRLVIQKGDAPVASEGEVLASGLINADASDLPWADRAGEIGRVYFRDNLVGMTSLENFFAGMSNIDSLDLSRLDSSDATSFSGMFNGCTSLQFTDVNLDVLDRSSVTDISAMFSGCDNLYSIDLTGWVTSQVVSASGLFNGCDNLTTIVLDNWDLAGMTGTLNLSGIFSVTAPNINVSCKDWQNIPVNFSQGFGRTLGVPSNTTVETLDVTDWDLSETTNISALFANLRVNRIIGLDSWNTENITNMNQLFYACTLSDYSDVYDWNISNVTNIAQMFCSSNAVTLDLSNWDTHNVTVFAQGSFIGPNTTTLILDNWDFSGINSFLGNGFLGNTVLTTLSMRNCTNIPNFTGSDSIGRAMNGGGCHFETIDVTGWDLSRCTSLNAVFANITVDNLVGYKTWDTSHIQDFSQVFCYTKGLTDIDISAWDFSSATTVSYMFSEDGTGNTIESVKLPTSFTSNFALSDTAIQSISQAFRVGDTVSLVEDFTTSNQVAGTYTPVNVTVLDPHQGTLTMPSNRLLGTNDTPVFLWDDTYRDTLPDENSIVRTHYTFFGWEDADGVTYTDSSTSFPDTLIADWDNYVPQTATAGVDLYRVVYNQDGTVYTVYQKGNEIDPDMGTVISNPTLVGATNAYIRASYNNDTKEGTVIIRDYIEGFTGQFHLRSDITGATIHFQNLDYIDTSLVTRLGFNNAGSNNVSYGYAGGLFYAIRYADGLEGIANWDTSNVTDMSYLFSNVNTNCIRIPDHLNWDTSNVTNMAYMFNESTGDFSCVENWNTSNVTNFNHLCYNAKWFHLLPLRNWNTGNVTTLNYAFAGMTALTTISALENWDTHSVTTTAYAFTGDSDLTSIYNLNWDMSSNTNVSYMFQNCTKLQNIDGLSGWTNTNNIADMAYLFDGDVAITSLDGLSTWRPNPTTTTYMCRNNEAITNVDGLSEWNTPNLTNTAYMFAGCISLRNVDGLADWDMGDVTDMSHMFEMPNGTSSKPRYTVFEDSSGFANWDTHSVTNMANMFYNLGIEDITPLAGWTTDNVTDMSNMFAMNINTNFSGTYIDNLDALSEWNTGNVTNMSSMFKYQQHIRDLNGLADWDVSKVTSMEYMFQGCSRLRNADGAWAWHPTNALTRVYYMFSGDSALTRLDLGNWDLSGLTCRDYNVSPMYIMDNSSSSANLVEIVLPESFPSYSSSARNTDGSYTTTGLFLTHYDNWLRESDGEFYNMAEVTTNFTSDRADTYYRSYNLTLYPMGGEVDPRRYAVMVNEPTTITLPTPERQGYTFDYWYDAEGNQYTDSITIPAGKVIKNLYAHWSAGTYTLILKPNRAGAGLSDVTVTLNMGETFVLAEDIFEVHNYHITSWTTRSGGQGDSYLANEEVMDLAGDGDTYTLYAQWASNADSDETITLNFHQINVLTGEETYVDEVTVPVDGNYQLFDHDPMVEHGRIVFCSYSDDLDAVHFDGTGLLYDEYKTYQAGDYTILYNGLTAERADLWDYTHNWEADEDGTDLYVYYIPDMRVAIHFAPQITEHLSDDVVMTINGQDYRDGEYILYCGEYGSNFGPTYNALRGLYNTYNEGILSPDSWLSIRQTYNNWNIVNQLAYNSSVLNEINPYYNNDISFNYDYLTLGNSGSFSSYIYANPYVYVSSGTRTAIDDDGNPFDYEYWQYGNYQTQYMPLKNYTGNPEVDFVESNYVRNEYTLLTDVVNTTYDIWLPLTVNVNYYNYDGTLYGRYSYNAGSGYTPDLTQITDGIFSYYSHIPKGYVFDGMWTEQEGGVQIIAPGESRRSWSDPVDGTSFNMTLYAHIRQATPDDNLQYRTVIIHNDQARRTVTTRSFYVGSNNTLSPTFRAIKSNFDVNADLLPLYDTSLFFMGWYTEPNGEGERITYDTVIEDGMDVYAYWDYAYVTAYYDLYSSDVHPSTVTDIVMPVDTANRFVAGDVSYFTCRAGTKFDSTSIPITNAPINEAYNFMGWFTEPNGQGEQLVPGTQIDEDTTYYAYWQSAILTDAGASLDIDYNITWATTNNTVLYSNSSAQERIRFIAQTGTGTTLPVGTVSIYGADSFGCNRYNQIIAGKYFGYLTESGYDASGSYYSRTYIKNNVEITGGFGIDNTITRSTGYSSNPVREYPVRIVVDLDPNDDTADIVIERTLYLIYNSSSSASTQFQSLQISGEAQFAYPTRVNGNEINYIPDDADQYFYVHWVIENTNANNRTNIGGSFDFTGLNLVDVGNGGEVVMPENAQFEDGTYDIMGSDIWVRYPRTLLDVNTGRAIVNQTFTYFEAPAQRNLNNRISTLRGTATLRWDDSPITAGEYEFMIGRGTVPYRPNTTNRSIQQLTSAARPETSRNHINTVPNNNNNNQPNGMYWYVHEASTVRAGCTHAIGMQQGDLYYNSGAGEDYYMLNPQSGNYILTDNDYYINNIRLDYNLIWRSYNEETGTYDGPWTYDNYSGMQLEIWVRYAGESDMVLYQTINPVSNAGGQAQSTTVTFAYRDTNNGYALAGTNVVDVQVRISAGDTPCNAQITLCPNIYINNNLTMHQFFVSDASQYTSSVFKMDGRIFNYDQNGDLLNTYSFFGGWGNTYFDEDCLLDLYEITPDQLGDISWRVTYDQSSNYVVDHNIVVYNQSTTNRDWRPVDSFVLYVLADDEFTSLQVGNYLETIKTSNANNGRVAFSGGTSGGYSDIYPDTVPESWGYGSSGGSGAMGRVAQECMDVDIINNWNNTGRQMAIIRVTGLSQYYSEDAVYNGVRISVQANRPISTAMDGDTKVYRGYTVIGECTTNTGMYVNPVDRNTYANSRNWTIYSHYPVVSQIDADTKTWVEDILQNYATTDIIGNSDYSRYETIPQDATTQFGFNSYVANNSGSYTADTTLFPGEPYHTLILYGVDTDAGNRPVSDIVINAEMDGLGTWTSASIPTITNTAGDRCTPDVWYCMTPNPDFEHIDADHGWTQDNPTGSTCYGVHMDYTTCDDGTPFVVTQNQTITIRINEKNSNVRTPTTGEIICTMNSVLDGSVINALSSNNVLTVVEPDLAIHIDATPESGTEELPTLVHYEDDLNYILTVTNRENRPITNVVVIDQLPDHLHYDLANFTVLNKPILNSPIISNVSLDENNVLRFTINSLGANTSLHINTNAWVEDNMNNALLTNHAIIDSYFDVELDDDQKFSSNTTYHKIEIILPEPTGFAMRTMPYVIVLTTMCGMVVVFRKKKRTE